MQNILEQIEYYHETVPLEQQLVYLSGKWFLYGTKEEIKNPVRYLLSSSLYKDISKRCLFFGNVKKIDELEDWIENYKQYPSPYNNDLGIWYAPTVVHKVHSKSHSENDLKDYVATIKLLPYKLTKKEFYLINRLLFHPEDEVIYIIYGIGGSGKSTLLNLIKQLFDNDVSPCSIDDLSNEFQLAEACKHRLICSDEINTSNFNNGKLKMLASKQLLNLNPKNKTPYAIKSQSSLIFATNKVPYLDISDSGIIRRICFYSKNKKIANPNPKFQNYIFKEEELLAVASFAYVCFEDNNWMSNFTKETHDLLMKNNSVYLAQTNNYDEYRAYCARKGYKPFSENNFFEIKQTFQSWEQEDNVG